MPRTQAEQPMRCMPGLLGSSGQDCDVSLEMENGRTGSGSAMTVRAPTGKLIIGTLERLSGRTDIVEGSITRNENGTLTFEYEGYTEVFWEEQRTVHRNGKPIFLDEEGFQWEETQLLFSEE